MSLSAHILIFLVFSSSIFDYISYDEKGRLLLWYGTRVSQTPHKSNSLRHESISKLPGGMAYM